jgi:hypothetical protein
MKRHTRLTARVRPRPRLGSVDRGNQEGGLWQGEIQNLDMMTSQQTGCNMRYRLLNQYG